MSRRREGWRSLLAVVACLPGCHRSNLPAALRDAPRDAEVRPFTGFSLPGVELWQISRAVPDKSESVVVGLDGSGNKLDAWELLRRSGDLGPEERARRALALLLGQTYAAPLSSPAEVKLGATPQEAALVQPPVERDGLLVFWVYRGEMAPVPTRVTVDLAAKQVSFASIHDVARAQAPKPAR